jgi:hypothetical protein
MFKIFNLLIIYSHDRMDSITRVLHTETWNYFASFLPYRFIRSPKVVRDAIMTDINDLVQDFWRTPSDGAAGASFFAMRRLLEILEECLEVCFVIISFLQLPSTLLIKSQISNSWHYSAQSDLNETEFRAKFKILFDRYGEMFGKMFDQSLPKSKDLGDMFRFLPGVVVQKQQMSMQGMADLYKIKPDLLERLIKSSFELLRPSHSPYPPRYILDGYLSDFLQDRDRSQPYYCDPMLQHISICRHFLSLLDGLGSNALDLQS